MKAIKDVTIDEWADLTEAAIELLYCARLMFLLAGGDRGYDDKSQRETLDLMAKRLKGIGLDQGTIAAFERRLGRLLRSKISPEVIRSNSQSGRKVQA